jgi:hypothetical protein
MHVSAQSSGKSQDVMTGLAATRFKVSCRSPARVLFTAAGEQLGEDLGEKAVRVAAVSDGRDRMWRESGPLHLVHDDPSMAC